MVKIDLDTSELANPIINLESKPRLGDGLNEIDSLGILILTSNVPCVFLWVCLINFSHSLVSESYKPSVSFVGLIMAKFILITKF